MTAASNPSAKIRLAREADLPEILRIYNHAVLHTTATLDLEPRTLEDRRQWLLSRSPKHPVVVLELTSGAGGKLLGWASLSPWSDRAGYAITGEPSLYLDERARGQGHGRTLMKWVVDEGTHQGFHSLISRIDAENAVSIALHEKFDFQKIGRLHQAGFKNGKFIDVDLLQWMNPNSQNSAS